MANDRERSKSPMGRVPLPVTVMNVKMCCAKCEEKAKEECEEIEGVVKVVTHQSENKVIVYGPADQAALLKKMKRHLDRHAMFWPADVGEPVPPLFPIDPRELKGRSRGIEEKMGLKLETGTPVVVDERNGRPIVEPREVKQLEREMKGVDIRERHEPREHIGQGHGPGHQEGPREVVFIPVDAKDGTPVDPRRVVKVDTREGIPLDPREVRPIDPHHDRPIDPREIRSIDPRDVRPIDPREIRPIDPRDVRQIDPRDGRPVDPREMRPVDPRDVRLIDPRPVDRGEVRPIDPRMVRPVEQIDPRDFRRMDPSVMRQVEPIDRDMRPVDARITRPIDPRPLDLRDDPRDGRSYGPTSPRGMGIPEGLGPLRMGRDSGEYRGPVNSQSPRVSPRGSPRGEYGLREPEFISRSPQEADFTSRSPRGPDYGPRSPREADYGTRSPRGADYGPRSPREGDFRPRSPRAPDYGTRSPREADYLGPRSPRGGEYMGPRSPRAAGPVLDRELSFNVSIPDERREMDGVPVESYRPVEPRASDSAFEFRGAGDPRDYAPRSPRGNLGPPEPMVAMRGSDPRGYGQSNTRELRPAEPRVLLDVTKELRDPRDREYDPRDYRPDLEPPRREHISQYSEFRRGEADPREYHPKESYFSDYHPSQNYQPGPLATQELDTLPVTNPNYMKHIATGP